MSPCFGLKDDRSEKIIYDLPGYPILARHALLSTYPNYSASIHWHDAVEFAVVLSGSTDYNVNGTIIPLNKSDGIFINSRQLHFGSSKQTECSFLYIILHPVLLCTSPAIEHDLVSPLIQVQNAAFLRLSGEDVLHKRIIDGLKYIYDIKDTLTAPLKIQGIFSLVWADILGIIPQTEIKKTLSADNLTILKNMVGFIQERFKDKISLADIARAGAVGQSKCCRLFQACLSQTPNTYLTSYRLDKSCVLLRDTDMTIAEIALEVGFGSASYFTETFRKWYAQTPTKYRSCTLPQQHITLESENRSSSIFQP